MQAGAGIFVTVNETDGTGRTAANIVRARAVFVDLDGSPLEPVLASQPAPHLVTEFVSGPMALLLAHVRRSARRLSELQKALAAKFSGDPKVHDLPRA